MIDQRFSFEVGPDSDLSSRRPAALSLREDPFEVAVHRHAGSERDQPQRITFGRQESESLIPPNQFFVHGVQNMNCMPMCNEVLIVRNMRL